jgi:adenine phosphoribosyltransferase
MQTQSKSTLGTKVEAKIRDVADFPKPGIIFKDITPVLQDISLVSEIVDYLYETYKDKKIDYVLGIESRGFILAVPLAMKLGVGFVPIRKPGKLPAKTLCEEYELEYGTDKLEIHEDAFENKHDMNALIIDDLLATGGTALAAAKLVKQLAASKIYLDTLIELSFLNGRQKLLAAEVEFNSLLTY